LTHLANILSSITPIKVVGETNKSIAGLAIDSRKVSTDFLFAAIVGWNQDGHSFIETAIEKGATGYLCVG
jgi:UDP-N-acetylmuramoyl-L-alanyl-D-glutamate--2,6-diaminopimelate ligase